jgi:DNA topoisomerase-1
VRAEASDLLYVTDDGPGIRRRRRGRGFSYAHDGGRAVSRRDRARIEALAIPPAWTDVWISPEPQAHLQATGRDARGRKVYRYHPRWREERDADKYEHLYDFAVALERIRRRVAEDASSPTLGREKVLGLVVRLLDETLIRVGNPEYATDNDSFGLTTLRQEHVDIGTTTLTFDFVGKGGIDHEIRVSDPRIARAVRRCHELGGKRLFTYQEDGEARPVTSADVNDYLREVAGPDVSSKDFRTWGGTTVALEALATEAPAGTTRAREQQRLAAIDHAAEMLGNTRAVCRACYVHPAVLDAHEEGTLEDHWRRARETTWYRRGERAALSLLAPEGVG